MRTSSSSAFDPYHRDDDDDDDDDIPDIGDASIPLLSNNILMNDEQFESARIRQRNKKKASVSSLAFRSNDSNVYTTNNEKIGDKRKKYSTILNNPSIISSSPSIAISQLFQPIINNNSNMNMNEENAKKEDRNYGTSISPQQNNKDVFSYMSIAPGINGVLEIEEESTTCSEQSSTVITDDILGLNNINDTQSHQGQHRKVASNTSSSLLFENPHETRKPKPMLRFLYEPHSSEQQLHYKTRMLSKDFFYDTKEKTRIIVWIKLCLSSCFVFLIAIIGVKCIVRQHSNTQQSLPSMSSSSSASFSAHHNHNLLAEFEDWMKKHSKSYNDHIEKTKRFQIWKDNHHRTLQKNKNHGPCKMTGKAVFGSNHFKDLTTEEFQSRFLTGYIPPTRVETEGMGSEEVVKKLGITFDHLEKLIKEKQEKEQEELRVKLEEQEGKVEEESSMMGKQYFEHWSSVDSKEDTKAKNQKLHKKKQIKHKELLSNEDEEEQEIDAMGKKYIEHWSSDRTGRYKRRYIDHWSPNNSKYYNRRRRYYRSSENEDEEHRQMAENGYDPSAITFSDSNPFNTCGYSNWSCWLQWLFNSYPYYGGNMEPAYDSSSYPESCDWRDMGAVTDIHSQGQCGACWAIAAVETVESAVYLKTGTLYDLAEEEVILCDDTCEMCYGGWPQNAYEYVMDNGGLPLESNMQFDDTLLLAITLCKNGEADYFSDDAIESYMGQVCPAKSGSGDGASNSRYGNIQGYGYTTDRCICYTNGSGCDCDEQDEEKAISNIASYGPAVVCLDASVWQDYEGGIMTAESGCSSEFLAMNHCVQVVGYAFTDSDEEGGGNSHSNSKDGGREGYWIVRNQWSSYWGMNGYAYLAMGGDNTNTCGILNDMTQAFV